MEELRAKESPDYGQLEKAVQKWLAPPTTRRDLHERQGVRKISGKDQLAQDQELRTSLKVAAGRENDIQFVGWEILQWSATRTDPC